MLCRYSILYLKCHGTVKNPSVYSYFTSSHFSPFKEPSALTTNLTEIENFVAGKIYSRNINSLILSGCLICSESSFPILTVHWFLQWTWRRQHEYEGIWFWQIINVLPEPLLIDKYSIGYQITTNLILVLTPHTAKTQYWKFETNILRKKFADLGNNFHIHVSVNDLYIPTIGLPILLQENMWTNPGDI